MYFYETINLTTVRIAMKYDEIDNKIAFERILFHLDEAMKFCKHINLSGLSTFDQKEWKSRINLCKNAMKFTKDAVTRLNELLFPLKT
jgi:hypothetical protein